MSDLIILGVIALSLLSWFIFRPPPPKIIGIKDGKIVWNYEQT